jgi:carbon storage regulator
MMTKFKEFVMLVLSRKQGESIVIANDIVVNVVDIGRGRVQIGVSAPPHLSVHRQEIHRRILDANRHDRRARFQTTSAATMTGNCD